MNGQSFHILLVEDNPADVYLFRQALKSAGVDVELTVIEDGAEALAFARRFSESIHGGIPRLAVIDLNLPKYSGIGVIEAMRQNPDLADVPMTVISSSATLQEQARVAELGVKRFITKPPDLDGFLAIGEVLKELLFQAAGPSDEARLKRDP